MPTQIFKWELESIFYLTGKFGEKIGMMQTLPLKLLTVIFLTEYEATLQTGGFFTQILHVCLTDYKTYIVFI